MEVTILEAIICTGVGAMLGLISGVLASLLLWLAVNIGNVGRRVR